MDFKTFFLCLSQDEQERFAVSAGTTTGYIRTHLIAPLERRKTPRRELIESLVKAGQGKFTRDELLEWFFPLQPDDGQETSREAAA